MQMVMAIFAYIYYQSFVASQENPVEMILDQVNCSLFQHQLLFDWRNSIFCFQSGDNRIQINNVRVSSETNTKLILAMEFFRLLLEKELDTSPTTSNP